MTQRVTDRAAATYESLLTINQPLASIIGSTFTCTVTNPLGSDTGNCKVKKTTSDTDLMCVWVTYKLGKNVQLIDKICKICKPIYTLCVILYD